MKENLILQIVKEAEILGKNITMYGTVNSPLFLATDVAEWIDYSKSNGSYKVSQMLKPIDDELKGIYNVATPGGIQEKLCITENGLYDVCMLSRKEGAKKLRKEIKLYLKQIRLTGGYIPISESDSNELIMARALKIADKTIQEKDIIIQEYQKKINELKPDADLANDLIKSHGLLTLKEVADTIEIGRTKLCSLLRDKKILSKQTGFNTPMRQYIKSSYFKTIVEENEKTKHISIVTLVTPMGLKFIHRLIKKNELLDEFDTKLLEVSANA